MKKLIGLASIMLITLGSFAQNTGTTKAERPNNKEQQLTPEQRAIRKFRLLSSKVELDKNQSEQVKQIFIDFEKKKQDLFDKHKKGDGPIKAELKPIREESEAKLKEVIGQEKFETWQQLKKERAEQKRAGDSKKQKGKTDPNNDNID